MKTEYRLLQHILIDSKHVIRIAQCVDGPNAGREVLILDSAAKEDGTVLFMDNADSFEMYGSIGA